MKFTPEQLAYITDETCKYGHLVGWSLENDCYKCETCGELIPLKDGEEKPTLISCI